MAPIKTVKAWLKTGWISELYVVCVPAND